MTTGAGRGKRVRRGEPIFPPLPWAVEQLRLQTPEIFSEIRSELPGRHHRSTMPEPVEPNLPERDTVFTGQEQNGHLLSLRHWILGLGAWLTWFGIGIYTWWFTDASVADYVIASVIWAAIFAFAVVGVPIVRAIAINRDRQ